VGRAHGAVQLPARRVRRRNAAAREPIPAGSQVIRNWRSKFFQCLDLISTKAHHGTHSGKLTRPNYNARPAQLKRRMAPLS
jgi:hypothetical protein